MDADYSVELGPGAPALEIPWHDPEGRVHYVELRTEPRSAERNVEPTTETNINRSIESDVERNPERILERILERIVERIVERIPEAQQFPAMRRFLIDLNSPQSAWQTAKCDVWSGEAETENLYGAGYSQACYVDLVLTEQAAELRGRLDLHQQAAKEIAQRLETNDGLAASAEIVVRRCYFHPCIDGVAEEESEAGYCLTLFLAGFGASPEEAAQSWERAMEFAAKSWLTVQLG
jgi:hypothetical protein